MDLYPNTLELIGRNKVNYSVIRDLGNEFDNMIKEKRKEWRPVIKRIGKIRDDIFSKIRMKDEPIYEMFWFAMLPDYDKQILKEYINLERINKTYRRMKKEGMKDISFMIEKAKSSPISDLAGCRADKKKVMIRSPFCRDTNPSCCIYNESNSWYCFATTQGGSTIDWQMKVNGMNFMQAVRSLS